MHTYYENGYVIIANGGFSGEILVHRQSRPNDEVAIDLDLAKAVVAAHRREQIATKIAIASTDDILSIVELLP